MTLKTVIDTTLFIYGWVYQHIAAIFGGPDILLSVLALFIVIDFAIGIWMATLGLSKHTCSGYLSSKVMSEGAFKKFLIFCGLAVFAQLEQVSAYLVFRNAIATIFILSEATSILEHVIRYGALHSAWIKRFEIYYCMIRSYDPTPAASTAEKTDKNETGDKNE